MDHMPIPMSKQSRFPFDYLRTQIRTHFDMSLVINGGRWIEVPMIPLLTLSRLGSALGSV